MNVVPVLPQCIQQSCCGPARLRTGVAAAKHANAPAMVALLMHRSFSPVLVLWQRSSRTEISKQTQHLGTQPTDCEVERVVSTATRVNGQRSGLAKVYNFPKLTQLLMLVARAQTRASM